MLYTKKMENLRNRIELKLVKYEKDYLKCTSKPSYMSHKIFDNTLVSISKIKLTLKLNKPAYIGMCILELSKVIMYEFHYNYIKNKNGHKLILLFTDTKLNKRKTGGVGINRWDWKILENLITGVGWRKNVF